VEEEQGQPRMLCLSWRDDDPTSHVVSPMAVQVRGRKLQELELQKVVVGWRKH